jgi:isocitrate dehydrogenase (NAD+)
VIEAAGAQIEWIEVPAGESAMEKYKVPLPDIVLDSIRDTKVCLKGPCTTPIGKGFRSVNVTLRQSLDLYSCLRRTKSMQGIDTPFKDVDIIIVRENTEGIYSGIEHMVTAGVVATMRVITEKASARIAEFAFRLAAREGREKVTAVHKANIMKLGDGLFLDCVRAVAKKYPSVKYEEIIIDNCCMQLVMKPQQFDILVMENFHGDILSDLTSGLVGGIGVTPGSNIGDEYAVFEAIHGSAPDIAGKGVANPTALILSAVEMLQHMREAVIADKIERAVMKVLAEAKVRTRDLKGTANTAEYTQAVITAMG